MKVLLFRNEKRPIQVNNGNKQEGKYILNKIIVVFAMSIYHSVAIHCTFACLCVCSLSYNVPWGMLLCIFYLLLYDTMDKAQSIKYNQLTLHEQV